MHVLEHYTIIIIKKRGKENVTRERKSQYNKERKKKEVIMLFTRHMSASVEGR